MKPDNREKETTMIKTYEHVPESKIHQAWRRYHINNDAESNEIVERDIDAFMSRTGERDRSKAYHLRERQLRQADEAHTVPQPSDAEAKTAGDELNALAMNIIKSGRVAFDEGSVNVGRVSYKEGLDLAALSNPDLGQTYFGRPVRQDGFELARRVYSNRSK